MVTTPRRRGVGLRKAVTKPDLLVNAKPEPKKKKSSPKKKSSAAAKKVAKKDEVYEIEKVISVKRGKGSKVQCEVKWKGYKETTWEPISYLNGAARREAQALLDGKTPKDDDKEEEEEPAKEETETFEDAKEEEPKEEAKPAEETKEPV